MVATVPPDVRLVEPIRAWMLDGASPWTQCLAVSSQLGRISAAPQKWPPPRFCSDAGNG